MSILCISIINTSGDHYYSNNIPSKENENVISKMKIMTNEMKNERVAKIMESSKDTERSKNL